MRKSKIIGLILIAVMVNAKAQEPMHLTTEQKIADFDSLYHQLEYAFPYFEVNKRLNNVDWLANYDSYKSRIKNTKDDREFLAQIDTIMGDLHCGHADILPTMYYHYMHSRYRMASLILWPYGRYVHELNKNGAKKKNKYWTEIAKQLYPESGAGSNLADLDEKDNITFEIIENESIAVMHIKSFLYEHIKEDKDTILDFFANINNYENLIIDIQTNSGGDTRYWQKNIVPYLINSPTSYSSYMAFRNTQAFYSFAGEKSGLPVDSVKLDNMPEELLSGDYLFIKSDNQIEPDKNSFQYKGSIYLLADHSVFSSSEAFANFCKSSGFAKVAGEITGGDGIGSDPFLYTLPISGIAIRYPGIMGLNSDGSSNEEMGTIPEIPIKGATPEERYNNLLTYIKSEN